MKFLYCKRALFVLPLSCAAPLSSTFKSGIVDWTGGVSAGSRAHEDATAAAAAPAAAAAAAAALQAQIATLQGSLTVETAARQSAEHDLGTAERAKEQAEQDLDVAQTEKEWVERHLGTEKRRGNAFTLASNLEEKEHGRKEEKLPTDSKDILSVTMVTGTQTTLKKVPAPEIKCLLATMAKQVAMSTQGDLDEAASAASRFLFALLADTWKSGTVLPRIHNAVKDKDSFTNTLSSYHVVEVVQALLLYLPYGIPGKKNDRGHSSLDYVSELLTYRLFDGVGCSSDALNSLYRNIRYALSTGNMSDLEVFFDDLSQAGATADGADNASVASLVSSSTGGGGDGSIGGGEKPQKSPKMGPRMVDFVKGALGIKSKSNPASPSSSPKLQRRPSAPSANNAQ